MPPEGRCFSLPPITVTVFTVTVVDLDLENEPVPRGAAGGAVRLALWPCLMVASSASIWAGSRAGWPIELWAPCVVVLNLVAVAVLERILPRVPGVDLLRDPQAPRDAAHGLLLSLVGTPVGSVVGTAALATAFGSARGPLAHAWPEALPLSLQVAGAWLLYTFVDYWKHRGYHSIDALWWVHALHHDVTQMHVLKGARLHLLEGTIRAGVVSLPLLVLGAPAEVLVWVASIDSLLGNLNHSNLDQRFPRIFHWLVPTVDLHHIHHAAARSLHDTNLGVPIFDLAFGTYTRPTAVPRPIVGLDGSDVPTTLLGQLVHPFAKWSTSRDGDAELG